MSLSQAEIDAYAAKGDINHNYDFYMILQNEMYDENGIGKDGVEKGELFPSGSLVKIDGGDASDYISEPNQAEGTIRLISCVISDDDTPQENFSTFSVSAGHDAVTYESNGDITIKYDRYVHLVKAHAFYTSATEYNLGSNDKTLFPTDNNKKQADEEKDTNWIYLDDSDNIITSNGKMITNGGSFTLKHGQQIVIHDLPQGTSYTITETDAKDYTTYVDEKENDKKIATGTITDSVNTVAYRNDRTASIPTNATTEYLWLIAVFLVSGIGLVWLLSKYYVGKRRRCRLT